MKELPIEIVEEILANKVLSVGDVLNFSLTCKQFYELVMSSTVVWKNKFIQK